MIFKKPKEINKSPLKRKPMNSPGESLQREMERLLSEDFFPLLMAAMYIVTHGVNGTLNGSLDLLK
jgi:hypothetical protein